MPIVKTIQFNLSRQCYKFNFLKQIGSGEHLNLNINNTSNNNNSLLDLDRPASLSRLDAEINNPIKSNLANNEATLNNSKPSNTMHQKMNDTGNSSQRLIDDLDSLKLEAMTTSMTSSSYSNKTNELINRTQNFLEKANLNNKNVGGASGLSSANHESLTTNHSNMTSVTPLTNGNNGTITTTGEDFMSNRSNQNSMSAGGANAAVNTSSREYLELVKELNRYKEENSSQKQQIEELKNNQQQF
jgi:hypothetical protein